MDNRVTGINAAAVATGAGADLVGALVAGIAGHSPATAEILDQHGMRFVPGSLLQRQPAYGLFQAEVEVRMVVRRRVGAAQWDLAAQLAVSGPAPAASWARPASASAIRA